MNVAILVPYRADCEHRARSWAFVREHYARNHPDWPVHVGTCVGEWSKGAAVHDALRKAPQADLLVVADADLYVAPDALTRAVEGCQAWAVPHWKVHRLTPEATLQRFGGRDGKRTHRPPYRGVPGGGLTVVRRDVLEHVPMDPRFLGWGGEDVVWGRALNYLHGPAWRGQADLWHLWHPPATVGQVGSPAAEALVRRYMRAIRRSGELDVLLDEAREALWRPSSASVPA